MPGQGTSTAESSSQGQFLCEPILSLTGLIRQYNYTLS